MAWRRRWSNEILGRQIKIIAAAGILLLGGSPTLAAQAKEEFALNRGIPDSEAYVLFPMEEETYEVRQGDSLWKIAERLWGDSGLYVELYEQNRETVTDPDLILPGQILQTTDSFYLRKQWRANGSIGISSRAYQFDTPQGCTVGILGNESGANFALFGGDSGYVIACLVREKESNLDGAEVCAGWEETVRAYAEKTYGDAVQNLQFERYLSEKGEPVLLYSYTYVMDFSKYGEKGSAKVEVSAGLKQSEQMQAEFVGFTMEGSAIDNLVRYVTASFEETLQEGEECTVNEENMQIYPSAAWEAESFNAFAWVESYFDDMLAEITGGREKEESRKDSILRRMREGKGSG